MWLGGSALEWPHQIEFNLKQDVGGAQVLFDSGVPVVNVPCMGVVSHLHSTVPEIEKYVEPHGEIGKFLAMRFKEYAEDGDSMGWSKEIWDMAPSAGCSTTTGRRAFSCLRRSSPTTSPIASIAAVTRCGT